MIGKCTMVLVLALLGCHNEAESTARTSNGNFHVDRLFTTDGCTVYRFVDAYTHYFTRCDGARSITIGSHTESCGKNCTKHVEEEIESD